MQPSKETHGCEQCRTQRAPSLWQLGKPEHVNYLDGKAVEVQTHFRCRYCAALWVHIVESGAGGHGDFWHPE